MRPLVAVVVAAAMATTGRAHAQSEQDRADARTAAIEGLKAFDAGRFQECVDLFQRAESLLHAPPHLLYKARCHTKLGQLVAARELYRKVVNEALPPGAPAQFVDAQVQARTELAAVEPRIAKLKVVLGGLKDKPHEITMDGVKVPPAVVGIPRAVDPGEHVLAATGDGVAADPIKVTLADGEIKEVVIELVARAGAKPAAAAAPVTAPATGKTPPADAKPSDDKSGLRIGSYAAFGVGAVGLGLGTLFALQSSSSRSEIEGLCGKDFKACPVDRRAKVQSLDDDASSQQVLSIVGFGVGVAGIGAGVTLFLMSQSGDTEASPADRASIRPWIGYQSAGVTGRF